MAGNTSNPPHSRSAARPGSVRTISKEDAQRKVLDLIQKGAKAEDAAKAAGRRYSTYKSWQKKEPAFADALRKIRAEQSRVVGTDRDPVPDFPEFCAEWLNEPLNPHQLRWWDVMCGREPRDLHYSMTWRPGLPNHYLFLVPPNHGKSTTLTMNYVTWRIHRNPNIEVIIVSQTEKMAKKFLNGIKQRLTSPFYAAMHEAFAPDGGWKDPDGSWTATEIYIKGKNSDGEKGGQKDPTVQALGVGGQIYGARADLVVLDDIETLKNVAAWSDHLDWMGQEVMTRPGATGQVIVCGTRVASVDVYQKLRDEFADWKGQPLFNYLAQPAVLETADNPEGWVTLWPERWPGRDLALMQAKIRSAGKWALVYQQADVSEDSDFPAGAVECSVGARFYGVMTAGARGHRERGMEGLYVCAGYDPAASGHSAFVVLGVDRIEQKIWLLDALSQKDMNAATVQATIPMLTDKFGIKEWVVEVNAMNRYVSQDPAITRPLFAKGVRMRPHTTGVNKTDPIFGVKSMAPLFLSCGTPIPDSDLWQRTPDQALIDLPNKKTNRHVAELVMQLITWQPELPKSQKTDLVMALWFAVIAARDAMGIGKGQLPKHMSNGFLSPRDAGRRRVINLAEMREERMANAR